jgi:hypothetical protein
MDCSLRRDWKIGDDNTYSVQRDSVHCVESYLQSWQDKIRSELTFPLTHTMPL